MGGCLQCRGAIPRPGRHLRLAFFLVLLSQGKVGIPDPMPSIPSSS